MINLGNVVIGSSLEAIVFAFLNNYKILINDKVYHYPFERLPRGIDYASSFFYHPLEKDFCTTEIKTKILERKQFLAEHILFAHNFAGMCPASDMISKILLKREQKQLRISTKFTNDNITVGFDNLYIFNVNNLLNVSASKTKERKKLKCIDWFHATKNSIQDTDLILTGNDFVSEVWFFRKAANQFKDLLTVSYIDKKDINDPEYGPSMVRLEAKDYLQKFGGSELQILRREIINRDIKKFEDSENIKYMKINSLVEYVNNFEHKENITKTKKILQRLYNGILE